MKKFYSFFLFIILSSICITISAQNENIPVRFAAGNFITGNNVQNQNFQKQDLQASLFNNDYYLLVQFSVLPSLQVQKNLRAAGLYLETYLPGNAYLAGIKSAFDFSASIY